MSNRHLRPNVSELLIFTPKPVTPAVFFSTSVSSTILIVWVKNPRCHSVSSFSHTTYPTHHKIMLALFQNISRNLPLLTASTPPILVFLWQCLSAFLTCHSMTLSFLTFCLPVSWAGDFAECYTKDLSSSCLSHHLNIQLTLICLLSPYKSACQLQHLCLSSSAITSSFNLFFFFFLSLMDSGATSLFCPQTCKCMLVGFQEGAQAIICPMYHV